MKRLHSTHRQSVAMSVNISNEFENISHTVNTKIMTDFTIQFFDMASEISEKTFIWLDLDSR